MPRTMRSGVEERTAAFQRLTIRSSCAAVPILIAGTQAAFAQTVQAGVFQPTIDALVKLFVVALLLESGLNALFTWRVFLAFFDGRGWKTLIMVGASWMLVTAVHITWLADLFNTYGASATGDDVWMQLLTALILAGGSSGIYNILLKLGYRVPVSTETVQPRPPSGKAWVSVLVTRARAVGPIQILLQPTEPAPQPLPLAIAGVVGVGPWSGLIRGLFFRNPMRFPQSAGHPVDPNVAYTLRLVAVDASQQPVACPIDGTYVFALGAIIDFRVTM